MTTEKRETHPARHKSRRKNSMRPSRAYRRRNWDTGTTNRKRTPRTRHGLRAAALTRLTTPARPPKNPDATQAEREKTAKVFTDMEGTELYEKMMEGSSEIGIRIKGLIEIRLKKSEKEFVVPDNIEEFDIRNYV